MNLFAIIFAGPAILTGRGLVATGEVLVEKGNSLQQWGEEAKAKAAAEDAEKAALVAAEAQTQAAAEMYAAFMRLIQAGTPSNVMPPIPVIGAPLVVPTTVAG